jgi:hypothetical protein
VKSENLPLAGGAGAAAAVPAAGVATAAVPAAAVTTGVTVTIVVLAAAAVGISQESQYNCSVRRSIPESAAASVVAAAVKGSPEPESSSCRLTMLST